MIRLPDCPICGRSVPPASDPNAGHAPFCSRRCKEVDLFRWSEGRYAIVESLDPTRLEILSGESRSEDIEDDEASDGD